MVDYSALLFDPVFGELGVPAMLSAGIAANVAITVIDETRAKMTTTASHGGAYVQTDVDVRSVGPAAVARIPELTRNGITRDSYRDSRLTFNGRTWIVNSYEIQGSPNGEDLGLVRFLLKASQ